MLYLIEFDGLLLTADSLFPAFYSSRQYCQIFKNCPECNIQYKLGRQNSAQHPEIIILAQCSIFSVTVCKLGVYLLIFNKFGLERLTVCRSSFSRTSDRRLMGNCDDNT